MIKPFKYKRIKKAKAEPMIDPNPPAPGEPPEGGQIDGMKASQPEINMLKAAYKTGKITSHKFRVAVGAPRNLPGYKELDFLLETTGGNHVAIQVRDFDFIHKGLENQGKDMATDTFILYELGKDGISLRDNKVYTIDDNSLLTEEDAKKAIEEILQ